MTNVGLGLTHMGARFLDTALGRWASPDSIVPDFTTPQSLNRYSFVLANPLRFVDPTGHFSTDELEEWYGKYWRNLFDDAWIEILLKAEFGDVVSYGDSGFAMFVKTESNMLVMWQMNEQLSEGLGQIPVTCMTSSNPAGLYRSSLANLDGGYSSDFEHQYETDARFRTFALVWRSRDSSAPASIMLGYGWYRSARSNDHIAMKAKITGLQDFGMGDAAELGGIGLASGWAWKTGTLKAGLKKVAEALVVDVGVRVIGAVAGGIVFGIEAYDWLTWDTSFVLRSGLGKPPIQPAPTPLP